MGKRNAVSKWFKTHKKEIILTSSGVVVGGTAVYIIANKKVTILKSANKLLTQELFDYRKAHNALCAAKDAAHLELASDALRHGSSIGGQELAAWKAFLKAA